MACGADGRRLRLSQIDNETLDMLKTLNMANLPGIKVQQVTLLGQPSAQNLRPLVKSSPPGLLAVSVSDGSHCVSAAYEHGMCGFIVVVRKMLVHPESPYSQDV